MIDLHAHILPGFDDGPDDWDTAVAMCRIAREDGIVKLTVTPHIKEGLYDTPPARIAAGARQLQDRIRGQADLEIMTGADVHLSADLPARIKEGIVPTINGRNYILLELPDMAMALNLRQMIFDLRVMGVFPLITHPERNRLFRGREARLRELVEAGAYIQLSSMSLVGRFGHAARRSAVRLLEMNLVHNIATDAHSPFARPPLLSPAVREAARVSGERLARMLVEDAPARVIAGEPIPLADFRPEPRRWFHFFRGMRL